jgi:hypothetical protein
LYVLNRFDMLISKIIFKKWKNIINMHFSTKNYLKSTRNHTAKHTLGSALKHKGEEVRCNCMSNSNTCDFLEMGLFKLTTNHCLKTYPISPIGSSKVSKHVKRTKRNVSFCDKSLTCWSNSFLNAPSVLQMT